MCCPRHTRVPDFTLVPVDLGDRVTPQEVPQRVTFWHGGMGCAGSASLRRDAELPPTFFDFPTEQWEHLRTKVIERPSRVTRSVPRA